MGITIGDIKRAVLGGNVSIFTEMWHRTLGNPPVSSLPSLEAPVALPEPTVLLQSIDKDLAAALAAWMKKRDYPLSSKVDIDITLVPVAPYGRNVGHYLKHVIDELKPDVMAVESSPLGLSANILYAFGIPSAAGLPARGEILSREGGKFYASETFYPGGMVGTSIIKSWLGKVPLFPVGIPQAPRRQEPDSSEAVDEATMYRDIAWANVLTTYRNLDDGLRGITRFEEGTRVTKETCGNLMKAIGSKLRESLVEEACYIASRIIDIANFLNAQGRRGHLLVILDLVHCQDIEYTLDLLRRGITDEIYVPARGYPVPGTLILTGSCSNELSERLKESTPEITPLEELFRVGQLVARTGANKL